MTNHKMDDFKKMFDHQEQKDRWWLLIKGKGDKLRQIPANKSLLDALLNYRRTLNLSDFPHANESESLIRSFRTERAISSRRVNQFLKVLCDKASLKVNNPEISSKLRQVSAHRFRHLSFSMQDLVSIRKQHIKENAGHATERTTEIYMHAIDNLRHEEMEKLKWKIKE